MGCIESHGLPLVAFGRKINAYPKISHRKSRAIANKRVGAKGQIRWINQTIVPMESSEDVLKC